jgi:hypothetical protein
MGTDLTLPFGYATSTKTANQEDQTRARQGLYNANGYLVKSFFDKETVAAVRAMPGYLLGR